MNVESNPYRALWSAVILQAFVDLKHRNYDSSGDSPEKVRCSAYRWINENDPEYMKKEGSFHWICSMLDLDERKLQLLSNSREGINRVLSGKFSMGGV